MVTMGPLTMISPIWPWGRSRESDQLGIGSLVDFIILIEIKDLLPNILKQLGPKQFNFIKDYVESLKGSSSATEAKKEEAAPELVEDFEEVSKQN